MLGTVAVGCGGSPPRDNAPVFQAGQPVAAPNAAPSPSSASAPPPAAAPPSRGGQAGVPPLAAIVGDQTTLENIISGALAGGSATLGTLLGGEVTALAEGIKLRAQTEAKGMKPVGELMSARLGSDSHAQASLS